MHIVPTSAALRIHSRRAHKPSLEALESRTYLTAVSAHDSSSLQSSAPAQAVYDLASQWSTTANPNGVWSYRAGSTVLPAVANSDLDTFTPPQPGWSMSATGASNPFWFKYSSAVKFDAFPDLAPDWQTGDVVVHTANDTTQNANITWTSPAAGTATIDGGVWIGRDIDRSDHWSILKNGIAITGGDVASGDAFSRANPFSYSAGSAGAAAVKNIKVAKGDVIELLLNRTSTFGDYVGVNLKVTETLPPTGSLSGSVFADNNANGALNTGEKGLAGVSVYLDANNNGKLDATEKMIKTDSAGKYSIIGLPAATYRVREVLPTGYVLTAPTAGFYDVIVTAGANTVVKPFADAPATASIAGRVYNDGNGDGLRNPGEAGLGLWKVFIDFNNNGVIDGKDVSATTDILGNWSFKNLTAGTYHVRVVPVSGLVTTKPTGGLLTITLTVGKASVGNLFGEKATA